MQSNNNTLINNLKTTYSLNYNEVNIDSVTTEKETIYVNVSIEPNYPSCPCCGSIDTRIHDYYTRDIKHGVFNNYNCLIKYRQRRYRCFCGKRFTEENPFVEKYNKISKNTKKAVMKKAIKKISFKDAASDLNISVPTFMRIFNKHCKQHRKVLPRVLSIDEFKGNSGGYKYLVSIVDPENKQIIDILPSRHKDKLQTYFSSLSQQERANVEIFVTDMWGTYVDIAKEFFPNATIVIDTFHFVRQIYWAFNNTRVRIMKKYSKHTKEYRYLKRYWKLLIKKSKDLNAEFKYDAYTKEYRSEITIIDFARNIHPELNTAYELKEQFYSLVDHSTYPKAYSELSKWIIDANNSFIGEFRDAASTIERWLPEISNSFMINPNTNKKYSNGYVEGTNNYIKVIKRISFGLRNFTNFRNKLMYQHSNSIRFIIG